jgi:hypothetical protein
LGVVEFTRLIKFSHKAVASEDDALNLAERTISWFRKKERTCRIGKIGEEIDQEGLRKKIL